MTVEKGSLGIIERQVLGKKQDYSYLFLGNAGWDITFRGARQVEDETWNRYRRTTENDILYILKVRRDEPGWIYEYVGNQVYLSRHVDIVDLNDSENRTVRVYFDHNTKLDGRAFRSQHRRVNGPSVRSARRCASAKKS